MQNNLHSRLDISAPISGRRVEVITAGGGRRAWTTETRAQIVAESLAPGAVVAEVARRYDLAPQQVHTWRRLARKGQLVLPAETPAFVPIIAAAPDMLTPAPCTVRVEIEVAGASVRVFGAVTRAELVDIITVLRRSA